MAPPTVIPFFLAYGTVGEAWAWSVLVTTARSLGRGLVRDAKKGVRVKRTRDANTHTYTYRVLGQLLTDPPDVSCHTLSGVGGGSESGNK